MYKRLTLALLTFFLVRADSFGQAVNNLNFSHWYDPLAEVVLQMDPVVRADSIEVFYRLRTNLASGARYLIKWEKRDSYAQRQGTLVIPQDTLALGQSWVQGRFVFAKPSKPWLLVASLVNLASGKTWPFFRQIESHFPVNGYVEFYGSRQWDSYLLAENTYHLRGSPAGGTLFVSYYKDNFPTPSPPFVVKEVKMDRFLFPDSVFSVVSGGRVGPFVREGLYLVQEDTASQQGYSFYVKRAPYPKYNKLADLKGPLLFVTTQEENDALGKAGEDKAKFDKVILDITKDTDRARTFMRNYFKRIEFANFYFTSFKEGWKTDRGMIFTIFGRPDEVQVDGGYEVWIYKNPKQSFSFARAGSVYHPDHSVLVRQKGYTENWYMTIDLWRKSRF
ncbi:MAG: GWxTD domain-containing protein [Cyclobacteriaceae bacterium]|nr:GWxTD domain-containing protein [Cyclobacteriaceae bacterium]